MEETKHFSVGNAPKKGRVPPELVFSFDDPIDYLNFELRNRRELNSKFSVRAWARELGYENPSYLSQVLKRERKLKQDLAAKLANSLALQGKRQKYFEVLVLSASAGEKKSQEIYQRMIHDLRPKRREMVQTLSLDLFSRIADWYHYVITEMPQLSGFQSDEDYIRKRLGNAVSKRAIREAVERLVRLGFLVRTASGNLVRGVTGNYTFDPNSVNQALRSLHRHWLTLAQKALDEQTVGERDFYFTTMSFRLENLAKAKEILRAAHRQVEALESTSDGEEIYQLNSQFFRLTKPSKRK